MANVKRVTARVKSTADKAPLAPKAPTAAPAVLNKGYSHAGASHTKRNLKGFVVSSGSPAEDINANNYTLRQRSRMLYMSAPIAAGALKRQRTNIVGPGLRLKSTIDREILGMTQEQADAWQRHTQAEFSLWANKKQACDATGVNNFYGMQQLVALAWPMSGDVFALVKRAEKPTDLLPYTLRLHLIEADRVRTPLAGGPGVHVGNLLTDCTTAKLDNGNTIFDGVEVNKDGAIVAYHVANTHPYQLDGTVTKFTRVTAYGEETGLPNILHVMDTERPEQYRGVPYLAQVIEPLLQMRRYTEAEITAAVVQSFFTAFITTEGDSAGDMLPNEARSAEQIEVSRDPNEYEMGPGTMNLLEPGEDVKFGAPTHPNTGFDTFMRAMCEQIGACLEIPVEVLLMSYNASFSAARGALQDAWKGFKMRREWLTDDFCRPVYEIWLTEAVARGRISAPGFFADPAIRQAYLKSEWIGPAQGMINPVQEVQAETMAVEQGFTTRDAASLRLNGSDYTANVDKLKVENEALKEANGGGNAPGVTAQEPPPEDEGSEKTPKEEENA